MTFNIRRAVMPSNASIEDESYGDRRLTSSMDAFEGMTALLMLNVIHDFGTRFEYLYGASYSRAIVSLIPRRIYPGKPQNFTAALAERYLPGVDTSLNASAIGDMYANFGPLTLLLFPLVTLSIIILSRWASGRTTRNALLSPALFVFLVWGARVTLEDSFIDFLFVELQIVVLRLENGLFPSPPKPARGTLVLSPD